jgi:hypothetical protein
VDHYLVNSETDAHGCWCAVTDCVSCSAGDSASATNRRPLHRRRVA